MYFPSKFLDYKVVST